MRYNKDYPTIRQFSENNGFPEAFLRKRVKQGRLPGFYSGKTFRIDAAAALEMISKECKENCKEAEV